MNLMFLCLELLMKDDDCMTWPLTFNEERREEKFSRDFRIQQTTLPRTFSSVLGFTPLIGRAEVKKKPKQALAAAGRNSGIPNDS